MRDLEKREFVIFHVALEIPLVTELFSDDNHDDCLVSASS
jgi:hypothetical protein